MCFVPGCGRPVKAGGLCKTHYERHLRDEPDWARPIRRIRKPDEDMLTFLISRSIPEGECLVWTGAQDGADYGTVLYEGKTWGTHRLAHVLRHGDIPPEVHVLHSCDNPPCLLDEHLSSGDHTRNMQEAHTRNRTWQSQRTHCPKGHPYDEKNTRIDHHGARVCKSCDYSRPRRGRKGRST